VQRVRDIFDSCGAEAFVKQQTHHYANLAKQRLERISVWDKPFMVFLNDIVDYSIQRQV
jgi:hypothetical protein